MRSVQNANQGFLKSSFLIFDVLWLIASDSMEETGEGAMNGAETPGIETGFEIGRI